MSRLTSIMKPLVLETTDDTALRELGRASVQVVHDLKNQINGLKLYATFLRKRMEKAARPADELETIAKLIAGLDSAANDTATLVRYGRPVELRLSPHTDLARLLANAAEDAPVSIENGSYEGTFDASSLSDALKSITAGTRPAPASTGAAATGQTQPTVSAPTPYRISLRRETTDGRDEAVIEWEGVRATGGDGDSLFRSFKGGNGLRMALAEKIIQAHGGEATSAQGRVRIRLPLNSTEAEG